MKKLGIFTFCVLFFLIFAVSSFGAKLVNYTYLPGEDEVNFVFIYDDDPTEFNMQSLDYGRYVVITTPGEMESQMTIDRFLGYSPVTGFTASAGKGEIMYRFDMLLPREPEVEIVANTLRITFKRNSERIESFSSYTDSTQMGDRPSLIALLSVLREYLDINLVIDETSLKGLDPVEFVMLSDNLRAEDFFLQIIIANPKIGYAFLPNNTIYVVRKEMLSQKVEEVLKETSISPQQETSYWASYDFNINKKSTLYEQFTTQINNNTTLNFSLDGFENYIRANFETYIRAKANDLQNDMIALAKGNEDEEDYVPVGLLLYGDNNRHERFNFFIQFLEGISFSDGSNPADTGIESTQSYTKKISYQPLTEAEVREFMEFYLTFRTNMDVPKQELIPDFEQVTYELSPLVSQVEIKGPVSSAKKLLSYIEKYISNRKARGMEKIVELKIKDGYGAVFAIALRRLFPKAIVDADGININQLVNKPTFEWTYDDVKDFGTKDGNPDRVTLFGSNYEILTAEQIADDWDWLVPALESEIRIISISGELPENIINGLQNAESPNALVNKFPQIEFDFNFLNTGREPLLFVKGKTHDLEILEGYLREIEEVSLGKAYSYFYKSGEDDKNWKKYYLNMDADSAIYIKYITTVSKSTTSSDSENASSTENDSSNSQTTTVTEAAKTEFKVEEFRNEFEKAFEQYLLLPVDTLKEEIMLSYDLNPLYNKVDIILVLYGNNELHNKLEEFVDVYNGLEIVQGEGTEYSVYLELERMTQGDVAELYNTLFKNNGLNYIYLPSRSLYKIFGVEKSVVEFVNELKKIDARRPQETALLQRKTELVNINIPSLTVDEVIRLVNINVPSIQVEAFGAGGYFITGLESEIKKGKDFLNSLGSDFIEESLVISLAPGINFETISNVLGLYYNSDQIQMLDFENSNVLLKGRKEKIQNAKLVLSSFGLIKMEEEDLGKIVKRMDYSYNEESGKIPPSEIISIINSYYQGVEIQYFEKASVFIIIGSEKDVISSEEMITEYANKTIVETIGFSNDNNSKYNPDEIFAMIKQEFPKLKEITIDTEKRLFKLIGDTETVEKVSKRILELSGETKVLENPIVTFADDGVHFNLNAQGKGIMEITKDIALGLSTQPKLFTPDENSTATSKINMNDLTWEEWLKITERLYDFNVDIAEGLREPIYIITPPGISHETGKNRKRTLNISHGYEEVASLIQSAYGGTVYADESNGLVVFTGVSDSDMESLKPLLLNTVEPKKMVEISAMVLDNSLIDKFNQDLSINIGTASPTLTLNSETGFKFEGGILDFTDFSKLLNAVTQTVEVDMSYNSQKEDGNGEQMIRPYVTTMSGEAAQILIGTSYYYRLATTSPDGTVQEQLITISSGYDLNITPTVNKDGTVFLDVNVGISSSDEYNPDGFPIQKTRNAVTKVLVNDTDTLVIGGLEGTVSSNSIKKLPFIGDLPFLGQFFTTKVESEDKRNVSIFITPRIIEVKGTPEEIFGQNID